MHGATAERGGAIRRDAELFAYLRLATAGRLPLLSDEDVVQAAETALKARARMHRCEVLAVGSGRNDLHLVIRFPASLSLKHLVGIVCEASSVAVARFLSAERQDRFPPDSVWGERYELDTLSPADVPAAVARVCERVVQARSRQLAWSDFLGDEGAAPVHGRRG